MSDQLPVSPWLTAAEAAEYARCSVRMIYWSAKRDQLRTARVGFGRAIRVKREWIDAWLEACAAPVEVRR